LRRIKVKSLDRQIEVLHPWGKHLAKHTPRFADAEFRGLLLLHDSFALRLSGFDHSVLRRSLSRT
jgi:hypothetical protein